MWWRAWRRFIAANSNSKAHFKISMATSQRVGIISQARMTSTRLPGKVLKQIAGKPLLEYHLARLRDSGFPIYLAITTNTADDVLMDFALAQSIPVVRGSEADVLERYQKCAEANDLDVIVRVTSDCPLIDGELIKQGISRYLMEKDSNLYLSNALIRTYPRGLDFEIFSRALLETANAEATTVSDREHVTPYINQNRSGNVRLAHFTRDFDHSNYRLTVDTAEDFELIRRLIEDHKAADMKAEELIKLLDSRPDLVAINAHIEQKKC